MTSACAKDVLRLDWRRPNRSRYGKWNDSEETGGHEPNEAPYTEIHPGCIRGVTPAISMYWYETDLFVRCLKLNGFVVDYLPFEQELSRVALLTCGKDCVDSGLRAPKTSRNPHNREGKAIKNHCLIQWPNWTGVFDDRGDPILLTKESLQMKDLGEALDGAAKGDGYFSAQSPWFPGSAVTSRLQPQEAVSSTSPPSIPVIDGETPVILATAGSPTADGNHLFWRNLSDWREPGTCRQRDLRRLYCFQR